MNAISPTLSAGLAALQALASPAAASAAPSQPAATPGMTGVSRATLSSATADAVLGLNAAAPSSAARRASDVYGGAIPAEKAALLEELGADAWSLRQPATLDDDAFAAKVLDGLTRGGTAKLAGFAEARENGTLRIQRAADMPELGYKSYQVTLYKEGEAFGGVGFGTMDNDRWMELRRAGIFAVTGSVGGNDYVATWPLPWDGGHADAASMPSRAA